MRSSASCSVCCWPRLPPSLLSRFDRRLRSLASIEAAFGTPVLSALPAVRQPVARTGGEPAPAEGLLEPLRRLHITLQLGDMLERDRQRPPRLILFLSADAGDGKSTLLADLALVQRDAGARVAVIEADMRRPVLAGLLGVGAPYGLSDVLAGALSLGEAWQSAMHLQTGAATATEAHGVSTAIESRAASVSVLLSGGHTANPPALLAERADARRAALRRGGLRLRADRRAPAAAGERRAAAARAGRRDRAGRARRAHARGGGAAADAAACARLLRARCSGCSPTASRARKCRSTASAPPTGSRAGCAICSRR